MAKLPLHAKILDAGCGPGRDSEFFASKGYTVTGIDLSQKFIEIAKKAAPTATFALMDLRKISFPKESFDGIWACASLLHLERIEVPAVLAIFHRILKPGGIVFILVREGEGKKLVRWGMLKSKRRFFTFFQSQTIRTFVTEAGFTIEEMYTWNQHDRLPSRPSQNWISCFARKK